MFYEQEKGYYYYRHCFRTFSIIGGNYRDFTQTQYKTQKR